MRRSSSVAAEILLVLLIMALAIFWLSPAIDDVGTKLGFAASPHEPAAADNVETQDREDIDVSLIAGLFGWEEPKESPPPAPREAPKVTPSPMPPQKPPPTLIDWLKPMGFVVGTEGETRYIFKNAKTNDLLLLRLPSMNF